MEKQVFTYAFKRTKELYVVVHFYLYK